MGRSQKTQTVDGFVLRRAYNADYVVPARNAAYNPMMIKPKSPFAGHEGKARFSQLQMMYKKAKPQRGRWGPCILTADEVFRQKARDDGFTDEEVALFIEQMEL
ncbi:MAG TPA: hypothetical protein PLQ89_16690 [Phycisphaerae bacterium]|nr:hypothetical protein [Phycisphaerae bacterium]